MRTLGEIQKDVRELAVNYPPGDLARLIQLVAEAYEAGRSGYGASVGYSGAI